jgi:hypothetical protein
MVPDAAAWLGVAQADPQAAAARSAVRRIVGAAAARTVVIGGVVVVTQAKEPHEPQDQ